MTSRRTRNQALCAVTVIAAALAVLGCGGGLAKNAACSANTCGYRGLLNASPTTTPTPGGRPTRLLAGPIVFRIVGRKTPKGSDALHGYGYFSVFRLNQNPYFPHPLQTLTRRGKFAIGARWNTFGGPYGISSLGSQRTGRHCFYGAQPTGPNAALDPIHEGHPLVYLLQPFKIPGRDLLGDRYVRHPILHTSTISLTSPTAVRLLKQIGCLSASREFFGSQ